MKYRTSKSFGYYQRNIGSGKSFGRYGQHQVKTFDPTSLVKNMVYREPSPIPDYKPQHTFSDFGFDNGLLVNISNKHYFQLTPIQDKTIPLLMEGRDVVGIANTGTGKTAAFLLPLINKVIHSRHEKVLIMAPTRELALQIDNELRSFTNSLHVSSALCIGGVSSKGQVFALKRHPNFVIGTPGRLKDLSEQGFIKFAEFNNVILDEVDRMLDMGFIREMTHILASLSHQRLSAFFSATTSPQVNKVMYGFLRNPITVTVYSQMVIQSIVQNVINTHGKVKTDVLHELLIKPEFSKVLVFGRTKRGLDKLFIDLTNRGFSVAAIHGNKSQFQRQHSLEQFRTNRVKVLLATDVASRGLDIDNITHVINFDLPESYEDYVHRIGRTGRAHKTGVAITLVD